MNNANLNITFVVEKSTTEVFNAVNDVSKWWTENSKGNSQALHDEFTVQFADIHYSKQRVIEFIPGKKVVWLITESRLNWLKNKEEWTGTNVVFEISENENGAHLQFTHIGLVPGAECYNGCFDAWSQYVGGSLFKLVTTGKGMPDRERLQAASR